MKYITWEYKLDQYLLSKKDIPFSWRLNDCVTFSTGAIEVMSGMDPAFFIKGKYEDKISAFRILSRFKLRTFGEVVSKIFKETPMRLLDQGEMVMYGDIVLADIENIDKSISGATAGVVDRDGITMFPGKDGIVKIPVTEVEGVWRV